LSNVFHFDDRFLYLCHSGGGFLRYDLKDYS